MKIDQSLEDPVCSCELNDTLETVAGLMWENDCAAVSVRDGRGRVVGQISDRDVCMAAYRGREPLRSIRVRAALSRRGS